MNKDGKWTGWLTGQNGFFLPERVFVQLFFLLKIVGAIKHDLKMFIN